MAYILEIQNILMEKIVRFIADSAPRGCTEDEGLVPRTRIAGAGTKTPQAALVKSHCGER